MATHNRYFIFCIAAIFCTYTPGLAQDTLRTPTFEFGDDWLDTTIRFMPILSPDGQYNNVKLRPIPHNAPQYIDSERIYHDEFPAIAPPKFLMDEDLDDYIFEKVKEDLKGLQEGKYWKLYIEDVVIDTAGRVIYFKNSGMKNYKTDEHGHLEYYPDAEQQKILDRVKAKVDELLYGQKLFAPALREGVPVNYRIKALYLPQKMISIKKGRVEIWQEKKRGTLP